jgi:hypothetical protein
MEWIPVGLSQQMMSVPTVGPDVTINLGKSLKNWKLKNLRAFLETSQLLYAATNAIIDSIAVTHMEWRVGLNVRLT